jgi:predicted RNA-binding protein
VKKVHFGDIRQDWYHSNQLVPRLVRHCIRGDRPVKFIGFPRQWIPVFEYFGIAWEACSDPQEYVPVISEICDGQLIELCNAAKKTATLRTLVESVSVLDPVLADFIYIIDHSTGIPKEPMGNLQLESVGKAIRLTSWQSYGRPEIVRFEADVDRISKLKSTAVLLPCSRKRPYRDSRTHHRIWRALTQIGYVADDVDQLVVSSIGLVPEQLWDHPVVMGYDAGVPDIYRVLRLARRFFKRNRYEHVVDCLEFAPYSDVLEILLREGVLKDLSRGPVSRSRRFYLKT